MLILIQELMKFPKPQLKAISGRNFNPVSPLIKIKNGGDMPRII
jgi:hypothetical protein